MALIVAGAYASPLRVGVALLLVLAVLVAAALVLVAALLVSPRVYLLYRWRASHNLAELGCPPQTRGGLIRNGVGVVTYRAYQRALDELSSLQTRGPTSQDILTLARAGVTPDLVERYAQVCRAAATPIHMYQVDAMVSMHRLGLTPALLEQTLRAGRYRFTANVVAVTRAVIHAGGVANDVPVWALTELRGALERFCYSQVCRAPEECLTSCWYRRVGPLAPWYAACGMDLDEAARRAANGDETDLLRVTVALQHGLV